MAVALGTAIAVAAITSAAASGTKAAIQAKAAKKAADQQVTGTQTASGIMQQGQDRLKQLYSPYVNAGAGAMGTLGRLTTPGPGARFASYGPPDVMNQPPGGGAMPRPGGPPPGAYGRPNYGGRMQMPDGRPIQGPYPMAMGGDMMVNQPTMFLAGEAGPERASFSGATPAAQQMQQQRRMQQASQAGPAGPGPMPISDLSQRLLQRYGPPPGPRPGGTFGQMMPPGGPMQGGPPPQGPPPMQGPPPGQMMPPQGPPPGPPMQGPPRPPMPQGPPMPQRPY